MTRNTRTTIALLSSMAQAVKVLKAEAAALRAEVDGYKQQLLDAEVWLSEYDGERITTPANDWMMEDAAFDVYWAQLDALVRAAHPATAPGCCPALVAESAVRDAERSLVDAARAIPGCEHVTTETLLACKDGLKVHREYVDHLLTIAN